MNAHETFALPASARVSLHQNGMLAVWDRLNQASGKTELGFKNLRDFPPPEIALALHTHIRDQGIKNLKILRLKKSIADRLLGIGSYRSGEAWQAMALREPPLLKIAPPAECASASPQDAPEIARIINAPLAESPNSRVSEAVVSEDFFGPHRFNIFLMAEGKRAGFGSVLHEKGHGEISWLSLLPEFQKKGHGKALMNELLKELSLGKHPQLSLSVESKNSRALKFFENYGFRLGPDLYFNLYG